MLLCELIIGCSEVAGGTYGVRNLRVRAECTTLSLQFFKWTTISTT